MPVQDNAEPSREPSRDRGSQPDSEQEAMRKDVRAALIVTLVSALLIGLLWFISRDAPSAGRDPNMTPLVPVATRMPTRPATPLPLATPEAGATHPASDG
jgi:hypothetical protein